MLTIKVIFYLFYNHTFPSQDRWFGFIRLRRTKVILLNSSLKEKETSFVIQKRFTKKCLHKKVSLQLAHEASAHAKSYLPCFLFTSALFCFADWFFVNFGSCSKLRKQSFIRMKKKKKSPKTCEVYTMYFNCASIFF